MAGAPWPLPAIATMARSFPARLVNTDQHHVSAHAMLTGRQSWAKGHWRLRDFSDTHKTVPVLPRNGLVESTMSVQRQILSGVSPKGWMVLGAIWTVIAVRIAFLYL